jgi:hypothetical protein
MASVEQTVKNQFARVFVQSDWKLFKVMGEFHLQRAANLKKADMQHVPDVWRLLARNAQKRLFIGIGSELVLKALYLKHGFAINKPVNNHSGLKFPFSSTKAQAAGITLKPDETYTLSDLIENLSKVPGIGKLGIIDRGLRIAKVFRNKEGHVVLLTHAFDPQNYRDVERALVEIFSLGFKETLSVRFAVARNEKAIWVVN